MSRTSHIALSHAGQFDEAVKGERQLLEIRRRTRGNLHSILKGYPGNEKELEPLAEELGLE